MSFSAYSHNHQDNMMSPKDVLSSMAPIPIIKTSAAETQERTNLQCSVNVGTNANPILEKQCYNVSVYDNQDVECFWCLLIDFHSACQQGNLFLNNVGLLNTYFQKALGTVQEDIWTNIYTGFPNTVPGFDQAIDACLIHSISPTALSNQKNYLCNYTKTYKMKCTELGNHLLQIHAYMVFLPGSNPNGVYDDMEMKYLYYGMMLPPWQLKFTESTQRLEDHACTYQMLVDYMQVKESVHNAMHPWQPRGGQGHSTFNQNGHHPNTSQYNGPPSHRLRYYYNHHQGYNQDYNNGYQRNNNGYQANNSQCYYNNGYRDRDPIKDILILPTITELTTDTIKVRDSNLKLCAVVFCLMILLFKHVQVVINLTLHIMIYIMLIAEIIKMICIMLMIKMIIMKTIQVKKFTLMMITINMMHTLIIWTI